jgi:hypothetical protein
MKEKDRRNRANKITRDRKIKRLIVIGMIVALAIGIGIAVSSSKIILSGASSSSIDNIQCNSMEQAAFHIHTHLDIFINGQNYTIPLKSVSYLANASIGYMLMMTQELYT